MQAESLTQKSIGFFIKTSGYLLIVTAAAKLVSSFGSVRVLNHLDPVFFIPFRYLLQATAIAEIIVALICFLGKSRQFQSGAVAILSSNFLLYRFGLYWLGFHELCPCLGNLSAMLPISPQATDVVMKIILLFLLIGSYSTLLWLWCQKKLASSSHDKLA